MSSTFNRLAYGRIAALRLVVTYLVGISVGAENAVALLAAVGAPTP
jgi:hypothetical protein